MRKTTTALLATAAALPLCFAAATPAVAADTSVTAAFTTTGNTVTGEIANTREQDVVCMFLGLDEPFDRNKEYPDDLIEQGRGFVSSAPFTVRAGETTGETINDLPIGQEFFIEWACAQPAPPEAAPALSVMGWGTPGIQQERFEVTDQPHRIVVGQTAPPETPVAPSCTGSVCLPTGSFGF